MRLARVMALVLSLAAVSLADKLVLKDGRTFEGTIVEETPEKVTIRTAKSTLSFPRKDIESLEKGANPVEEREKRLTALDPDNAAGYLEAAQWFMGDGRSLADEPTMVKLCNVAAYLDPALAAPAQVVLGNFLMLKGKRPEAAEAFRRAIVADPANEEAQKALKQLSSEATAAAKKQMAQLDMALELVQATKYKDAIAALKKCTKLAFADKAPQYLGMTIEDFTKDLQSRLRCETCNGSLKAKCTPCKGTGFLTCTICGGTGIRKNAPKNPTFAQEVCKHCYRTGKLLCQSCGAKMKVVIVFAPPKGGGDQTKEEIEVEAGVEKVPWTKLVDMASWAKRSNGAKVTKVEPGQVVGGTRRCPECDGVPYSPPTTSINMEAIAEYRHEIKLRIEGSAAIEGAGAGGNPYDEAVVEDKKFRYEGGNWKE